MERIISANNNKIKEIAALKDSAKRKKAGLIIVEGQKLISELLRCGIFPVCCFVKDESVLPKELEHFPVYQVSDTVMKKISALTTPQSIIAIAKEPTPNTKTNDDFILALDGIQDPSNMGAIIRSAEAFGVKTVVAGSGCCDVYSQKTLRGAMGSIFRLNIISCPLVEYLKQKRIEGYDIIGTGLDKSFKTVDKLKQSEKKVVVIGNEGRGISDSVKAVCDFGMYIPMSGQNESLNAAVAASIIMWENKRQDYER